MLRLANARNPGKPRKTRFAAKLPTTLPGISFTARGSAWYRQDPASASKVLPLREAEAATLAGVYEIAASITANFRPEASFHAEQAAAVSLSGWKPLGDSAVRVRAELRFSLAHEDAVKAERFTESRRAGFLDRALAEDHIHFLREIGLKDPETARLWWLHCNLSGDSPQTSWEVFRDEVRPLIHIAHEDDPVTRLTSALLLMNDYIHEDPARLDTLANIAAFAAERMGQTEVARTLATLRRPAEEDRPAANGSEPVSS